MRHIRQFLFLLSFIVLLSAVAEAQGTKKTKSETTKTTRPASSKTKKPAVLPAKTTAAKTNPVKPDPVKNEQEVRAIISFFQYVLNTIGSAGTDVHEKDVLIKDSYSKIFRDEKAQIEDDLDDQRDVITNKNVQAYLKDVDFFFKDVKFEFTIDNIKEGLNADQGLFYKVSLQRVLKGVDIEGKAVTNIQPRFIEINYDAKSQDLKIASIYTHEYDEKEALNYWWKELSYEWQSIFLKKAGLPDSVQLSDIKSMMAITELDLNGNTLIRDMEPLSRLINLKSLNVSRTSITDLSPLRNLTELEELNIANTAISDLSPLRYSEKLKILIMKSTPISSIEVLDQLKALAHVDMEAAAVVDLTQMSSLNALSYLNLKKTKVSNLLPIQTLINIAELNLSQTAVTNLNPIGGLQSLTRLYMDSTRFESLTALAGNTQLSELHINYTAISDLKPLKDLPKLKRIYCDHSAVTRALADEFMSVNPEVFIIFDSDDLKSWWDNLPEEWQQVLIRSAKMNAKPSKEELARMTNLDSLNISGLTQIQESSGLGRLLKLKVIVANGTSLKELSALKELKDIRYLDITDTPVNDFSVFSRLTKLEILKADRTHVKSISSLAGHPKLSRLYLDDVGITDLEVKEFLVKTPACIVIYKTSKLENWWTLLTDDWKKALQSNVEIKTKTQREKLHQLIELENLNLTDGQLNDLSVLSEFIQLKELHLKGTAVSDISPLIILQSLTSLHITDSPISNMEPISKLTNLEEVNISNTPVEDIAPLYSLQRLIKLTCAGTQIKKLEVLQTIKELKYLDCSNTLVRSLDPVMNLPLQMLKCYNTKIAAKKVQDFKSRHTNCQVVYY